MGRIALSDIMVGNEFVVPVKKRAPVAPVLQIPVMQPAAGAAGVHVAASFESKAFGTKTFGTGGEPLHRTHHETWWHRSLEFLHHYSVGAFALLCLLVGVSAIQVAGAYQTAHIDFPEKSTKAFRMPTKPLRGPNTVVPVAELEATIQTVTNQPITITVPDGTVNIKPDKINKWLQIVRNEREGAAYIHVNQKAIDKTLQETGAEYTKDPLNQVTATHADGTSFVIAPGRDGTKIGDLTPISQQIATTLLTGKGMQANLPIETLAFANVTPAAFDKMIEIDVDTKQMYLYEKGQLYKQYPISAGAPATPTPIGQYKIYSKLTVQDMRGYNADGTKYFQPHVRWINYFLPGGYAIHGNYWRPQSWFGAVNSSHGCASLPDAQAKEVYDWAPIGTTVITHH